LQLVADMNIRAGHGRVNGAAGRLPAPAWRTRGAPIPPIRVWEEETEPGLALDGMVGSVRLIDGADHTATSLHVPRAMRHHASPARLHGRARLCPNCRCPRPVTQTFRWLSPRNGWVEFYVSMLDRNVLIRRHRRIPLWISARNAVQMVMALKSKIPTLEMQSSR